MLCLQATCPDDHRRVPDNTFEDCLQSPTLQTAFRSKISAKRVATTSRMRTEGGIERAAPLYLVHDVSLIFEKLLSA